MQKRLIPAVFALVMGLTACSNNQDVNKADDKNTVTSDNNKKSSRKAENKSDEVVKEEKDPDTNELKKVTVVLDYTPNTNHTGLYVAKEKGYFKEKGIDVDIVQPPEDGAEALVASGKADFGVSYQDSMANVLAGDAKMPITAIAAIIQHNTSGIMARTNEGIDRPKGLEGKRYSTWNSPVELNTIKKVMEVDGGDFDKLSLIPSTPLDEVAALKEKQTDAIWVFEGWGKVNADIKDYPVDYWNFKDIDDTFDFYTPVLIANNSTIEDDKELVQDFVDATRKGYEYAIDNPKESADILLENDDSLDKDLVYASQEFLSKEYKKDTDKWGIFDKERWAKYYTWLNDNDLVDEKLDVNSGFTNKFVE